MSVRENRLNQVQLLCDQAAGYLRRQQFHRAIGDYLLALEIIEEWGTPQMAAALFHAVGSIYWQLKQYPRALAYYRRTLDHLPETDQELRSLTLCQIGQVMQQQKEYRHFSPSISNHWPGTNESLTFCF
ncbi:MAG: tetratricopeptide repeat protein [Anaerolineae bacterium]|nr:tetratricopeptide repeat protein [Anaerolineae bacterium]